mgnify:CR=1 FL=1
MDSTKLGFNKTGIQHNLDSTNHGSNQLCSTSLGLNKTWIQSNLNSTWSCWHKTLPWRRGPDTIEKEVCGYLWVDNHLDHWLSGFIIIFFPGCLGLLLPWFMCIWIYYHLDLWLPGFITIGSQAILVYYHLDPWLSGLYIPSGPLAILIYYHRDHWLSVCFTIWTPGYQYL